MVLGVVSGAFLLPFYADQFSNILMLSDSIQKFASKLVFLLNWMFIIPEENYYSSTSIINNNALFSLISFEEEMKVLIAYHFG